MQELILLLVYLSLLFISLEIIYKGQTTLDTMDKEFKEMVEQNYKFIGNIK